MTRAAITMALCACSALASCTVKENIGNEHDTDSGQSSGTTGQDAGSETDDGGSAPGTEDGTGDTKSTSAVTSGSTDSGPVHGIWRGIYNNPLSSPWDGRFSPCGGTETWCLETGQPGYDCTNMFVEVEGELAPPPNPQFCDSLVLTATNIVEIRRCREDDCADPPAVPCQPEQHTCQSYFECDPVSQDCPADLRCVPGNWTEDPLLEWSGTKCVPDSSGWLGEGEACSLEEQDEPCAPGSLCWDPDPDATTGHCVAFCDDGFACSGTCTPCPDWAWIALCRLDCAPPCDDGANCTD